jgi:hypothetical protein
MLDYNDTDHCDAPDERAKNPQAKRHLREIANGDADAYRFMWKFWCFGHLYDDLIDRDKPVTTEQAAKAAAEFVQELTINPFYTRNAMFLLPHLMGAFARWPDGDTFETSSDPAERRAAAAVGCGDIDLFLTIAWLTGGWAHMRRCRDVRSFDPAGGFEEG